MTELFGSQLYNPVLPSERQFTLNNIKKKQEFQARLLKLLDEGKVPQKIEALVKDFEMQWTNTASDETKIRLVARYQKLDNTVTKSMLSAANSIGRKNYGYQRLGEMTTAAYKLYFWQAVLSCKRRKTRHTKRVKDLAERLEISSENM